MAELFNAYDLNEDEMNAVKNWLAEYATANQMTHNELVEFISMNTGWILDNVFPSDGE